MFAILPFPQTTFFLQLLLVLAVVNCSIVSGWRPVGSSREYFIFNSTETKEGEALYHASVRLKVVNKPIGQVACGGALINSRTVLTAAQCVYFSSGVIALQKLEITGGNAMRSEINDKTYVGKASQIIVHHQFSPANFANDIAIIKLERPISPNHPTFKPISIANKRSPVSTRCLITGFGSTNPNTSAYSPILMTGTTYIISQEACKKHFSFLHDHIICAMRGSESCAGDSGGPLVCEGKLLGIMVMGGGGCGKILGPTGSTDVSKYLDWIARNDGSTGRLSDKYQVIIMPIIPIIVIVLNYYL